MRRFALLMGAVAVILCSCGPPRTQMSSNEQTFRAKCQNCHRLPNPEQFTDEQWPDVVERYAERANLIDKEIEAITAHLQAAN